MPVRPPHFAPRPFRFDLLALLVGITVWATLLSGLRISGSTIWGYLVISLLLIVVGLALALFRKLSRPITVSVCTTIVSNPEQQAGDNRQLLERLSSLRDSDLPYCHPDMPRAIGAGLIQHGFCTEPVAVHIHHSRDIDCVITFGEVYDDD